VPGWIIAKDDGGEAAHRGISTMCSYSPPPTAPAMEKHKSIKDHFAAQVLMNSSLSLNGSFVGRATTRRHRRKPRSLTAAMIV
jgi:hypothetical protein